MKNFKNTVSLQGFAGSDPVITNFEGQKRVARVSIAVNEFYKNGKGEAVNETHWFNLVFWNKKVNLIEEIVKKGTEFAISGKLTTQTYTKNDEKRSSVEIIVDTVEVITQEVKPA